MGKGEGAILPPPKLQYEVKSGEDEWADKLFRQPADGGLFGLQSWKRIKIFIQVFRYAAEFLKEVPHQDDGKQRTNIKSSQQW